MRYTLRLLTAQQFLRAASLVCVLEDIREQNSDTLGAAPFGIGIWLGGSSTPNTWKQALDNLRALRRRPHEQNLFLLLRCPWCGAQMGPQPKKGGGQEPIGYEEAAGRVVLRCIDGSASIHAALVCRSMLSMTISMKLGPRLSSGLSTSSR
jgi:hypothetical protein